MKSRLKLALLSAAMLMSAIAQADDAATAETKSEAVVAKGSEVVTAKGSEIGTAKGTEIVIAKGKVGQAPVQVVYDYLADRIADEYGVGEYRKLNITQQAAGAEDFTTVKLEVLQSGLLDDAIATQRYRFVLSVDDVARVWQIKSVVQDWQCHRGHKKAWTQRPCK